MEKTNYPLKYLHNIRPKKIHNPYYAKRISMETADRIKDGILKILIGEKKYKLPYYRAEHLAKELNTNFRYISSVFTFYFKTNYNQFINDYRIKEAAYILRDYRYKHITVIELAKKVGFGNRQSFYEAFYRRYKMAPGEYRKSLYIESKKRNTLKTDCP